MISHRGSSPKYRRSERHPVPVQELELQPLGYVTQCQDDCHDQPSSIVQEAGLIDQDHSGRMLRRVTARPTDLLNNAKIRSSGAVAKIR